MLCYKYGSHCPDLGDAHVIRRFLNVALPGLALVGIVTTSVSVQAVVIKPVAMVGQSAAGAHGVKYKQFNEYAINSTGQVFFAATLDDDPFDKGLWVANPTGAHLLLARFGETAPASVVGLEFSHSLAHQPGPIPDDAGHAFFTSDVSGNGEYGRGAWIGGTDGLQSVALAGEQAPGVESGLVLWDFKQSYRHNLAGDSVFESLIVDPENRDITNITSDRGIFRRNDQLGLSLVVRRGMGAPSLPDGVEFDGFGPAALTNNGNLLIVANLRGESINSGNMRSFWLHRPNEPLALLVRQGDPVAGLPSSLSYNNLGYMDANNTAQMAFHTALEGEGIDDSNRHAVLSFSPDNGLSLVARTGDQAPGTPPGVHFFGTYFILNFPPPMYSSAFGGVSVLNSGQVVFEAHLEGPDVDDSNDRGIWIGGPDELRLLIRTGDPVPSMPVGTVFAGFDQVLHNQSGEMLLSAWMSGPSITDANNIAIWRVSDDQPPELILREGDSIALNSADIRTVSRLSVRPTLGNDDGSPSRFNDAGQLVVHTYFTDGSDGLLVLDTTRPVLPGDYNLDGIVDTADYLVFRHLAGLEAVGLAADGDRNGKVDQADYFVWRSQFGKTSRANSQRAVPESATSLLLLVGVAVLSTARRRFYQ